MDAVPARRTPRFEYLPDADPATGRGDRVVYGWRLVAANHRPLGNGWALSGSLADCRADAARAQRAAPQLASSVYLGNGTRAGRWLWRSTMAGDPVARCPHPFVRRAECSRALNRFLVELRRADPGAGVVRYLGAGALRGYADPRTTESAS